MITFNVRFAHSWLGTFVDEMKFGKRIEQCANPEWKSQFIDYPALKEILKKLKHKSQNLDPEEFDYDLDEDGGLFLNYVKENHDIALNSHARKFFEQLQTELDKINSFYVQQEAKCDSRQKELQEQLQVMVRIGCNNFFF